MKSSGNNVRAFHVAVLAIFLVCLVGCNRGPKIVPVSGKVLYNDEPLTSGVVMFQPNIGPMARGTIQPDGTFELMTHVEGDGCTVGTCRVRVACSGQQPSDDLHAQAAEAEIPTEALSIPPKYAHFGSSGLVEEVREGGGPIEIRLTDGRSADTAPSE